MQIIRVEPKDIQITVEFSLQELLLLQKGLDATEMNLNLKSEADQEVSAFMTNTLYNTISGLIKELAPHD